MYASPGRLFASSFSVEGHLPPATTSSRSCTPIHLTLLLSPSHSPEQKLSIEITDVDGVHVDHVDVTEAREGEVLKDLTAKTASSDDEDLAGVQEVLCLRIVEKPRKSIY
ncbi:hypothetical protein BC936DRAFT_138840 [Jimgerdemannia flammicorona]|uniref:Uncharacterized protein n=1 Tax=Jimgerdemannia flammicorona TaxID=994334 RepID=A0A433DI26_9FUNG|nr:hypothetical protein BC936DRAFT_138840 [Jimgerdemannia flammicorona]